MHSDLQKHLRQAILEPSQDPTGKSSDQDTAHNISIDSSVSISKKITIKKGSIKITDTDYKDVLDKIVPIAD